jgi:hypothetical protein
MWRRFEKNKICRPKNVKQFQITRLEGQPHERGALMRVVLGIHYFLNVELKLHQLNQFSLASSISGQKVL